MSPLLRIEELTVDYRNRRRRRSSTTTVIDRLDLDVLEGETLALVGESGSGKSTLLGAISGLVPPASGSIMFEGTELVGLQGRSRRAVQRNMQVVFQNALLSLSPRRSVGWQLHEPLRVHTDLSVNDRQERIDDVLEELALSKAVLERRPHELSGGQAQRVVLARALLLRPTLILFDEPTSALDVSVQASVLNLLHDLKARHSLTYVFVTHDLGVARHIADRIAVLQSGELVELAAAPTLFRDPQHEYTRSLLNSSLGVATSGGSPC